MTAQVGDRTSGILRSAGVPYYVQVADIIREEVRDGRWAPGELIPSEATLCQMFAVSRTAIRQALGSLVDEGLLHKEKGRGTFVSRQHVALAVQELRGFTDEMADLGRSVSTRVLQQQVVEVPPAAAPALGVPMHSDVVCLERVRVVAGEPLVYVFTYLPLPRFAPLLSLDLRHRSLYEVLDTELGVTASSGSRRIDAVAATAHVAGMLSVRRGTPVLRVTATNCDAAGLPFEWFEAWYRADSTTFEVVVNAAGARR